MAATLIAMLPPVFGYGSEPPRTHAPSLSYIRMPGAETCIAIGPLAQAVETRLGRSVFVPPADAELLVEAWVQHSPDSDEWRANIDLFSATGANLGKRLLESRASTCDDLGKRLSLAIALMLDPEAAKENRSPSTVSLGTPNPNPPNPNPPNPNPPNSNPPNPNPPTIASPVTPPIEAVAEPIRTAAKEPVLERHPWRWGVVGGAAMGGGLLPSTGFGFTTRALALAPSFWAVEGTATFWGVQSVEDGSHRGAKLATYLLGLSPCAVSRAGGRAQIRGCAGVEVGNIAAHGFGFDLNSDAERWFALVGLHLRANYRLLGPIFIESGLSARASVVADAIVFRETNRDLKDVFRPTPVTASADLGVGIEFPP